MALDGTVISCMAWELNHALAGGKINKIAQPEKDELMLTIKNNRKQYRLLVSASASLSDRSEQDWSYDCPEFLYAAA